MDFENRPLPSKKQEEFKLIYSLASLFSGFLARPFPFLTRGYLIFLFRTLPFCQPGDGAFKDSNSIRVTAPHFPRGLGADAGVPIMAIIVPNP